MGKNSDQRESKIRIGKVKDVSMVIIKKIEGKEK